MAWQEQIKNGFRTAEKLGQEMGWPSEKSEQCKKAAECFPMMITPYYLSLVDKDDPNDPIAKMCIPSSDELAPGGLLDTSGEASNTKREGVQHKYMPTVLLLSSNLCATYCRYCFRKRLVGLSTSELNKRVDDAVDYVKEHEEVNNVLISGGDPLMNPNDIVERYLNELSMIDHLDFIRVGTRVPVTLPERIYGDQKLLDMFAKYAQRKAIYVVTQFNHPREITPQAIQAVRCLIERGVQVRNQSVLLRGVNDDAKVMAELMSKLTRIGVSPYYVFQCRPVRGVKDRFQVPISEGIRIIDNVRSMLNGFAKSFRYAMSHPRGKIEIISQLEDGTTMFKFHQCKDRTDNAKFFMTKLRPTDTWLDQELNGI